MSGHKRAYQEYIEKRNTFSCNGREKEILTPLPMLGLGMNQESSRNLDAQTLGLVNAGELPNTDWNISILQKFGLSCFIDLVKKKQFGIHCEYTVSVKRETTRHGDTCALS